jgi:hypothetical protein
MRFQSNFYWKNIYGISVPPSGTVQRVVLAFEPTQGRYFLSSPFFEPFKILEDTAAQIVVEMHLTPNIDLERKLRSLADGVRVLEPIGLRKRLAELLSKGLERNS